MIEKVIRVEPKLHKRIFIEINKRKKESGRKWTAADLVRELLDGAGIP